MSRPSSPAAGAPGAVGQVSLTRITQTYPLELPLGRAERAARVKGRTALTILNWPGSVPDAVLVLTALVRNALQHGLGGPCAPAGALRAQLATTSAKRLLIDVADGNPAFPGFSAVRAGTAGGVMAGLIRWGTIEDLICTVHDEPRGKTVRAVLDAGAVAL
ncbi:hypothetical protein [Streptomyces sp. NPDC059631]|uniref:hypothetical protein n=1 Tax=unclassified Streptomyces TaxID=2593676 RepID=UPI0036A8FB64